ncbi:MAG: serine/threonine protein kinase [Deltaproteobacteria bacterium]|nr:serine/threonine protein kinase [Deltaproteobacteria bacterium]
MQASLENFEYIGKYRLCKRLYRGGMGEVHLADELTQDGRVLRRVAVKTILPTHSEKPDFEQMFLDELAITAQLTHANIVRVYNSGYDQERQALFLAMEYIDGENIARLINRCTGHGVVMPPPLAAYVAAKMCSALDYAHTKRDVHDHPLRIVHRDITPTNVIIGGDGAVKIVDFGVAKATRRLAATTNTGVVKGKFPYMSPEQLQERPVDHRTDLFSTGVVLWEMLTGRKLFDGENELTTMLKVLRAKIPPPSRHNPSVPAELDRIVRKALARDVDKRYPSARRMYEDLEHFLRRQPTIVDDYALATFVKAMHAETLEEEQRAAYANAPGDAMPPDRPTFAARNRFIVGTAAVAAIVVALAVGFLPRPKAPTAQSKSSPARPVAEVANLKEIEASATEPAPAPEPAPEPEAVVSDKAAAAEPAPPKATPVIVAAAVPIAPARPDPRPIATPDIAKAVPMPSGTLTVATHPFTTVILNGNTVGQTPRARLSLRPGKNRVELVNKDFGIAFATDIESRDTENITLKKTFDGDLRIVACANCRVTVNGKPAGMGATTQKVAAGPYTVVITHVETREVRKLSGVLRHGEVKTLSVDL